ncbi:MAG: dihydrodipicolinate synthase family protein, partial [Nitrospinota bacterium]|nr:dihydrodipicolinate synthase family protein [Nitrospinota bacterium]
MDGKLRGIMAAPVTAFKADGRVDFETFERQINFLIESGFPFIAHPMHIGESPNLTVRERKELVSSLVRAAGGRV